MIKRLLLILGLFVSCAASAHAACGTLTSGMTESQVQTALGSCVSGNTLDFVAGTYGPWTSTMTIPCGVSLSGPTVPYSHTPNQTAIINGSSGFAGPAFQTTSGCSPSQSIQYIQWNGEHANTNTTGGAFMQINAGTTHFDVLNNWLHGADTIGSDYGSVGSQSIQVYFAGSGSTVTSNVNVEWNQFGGLTFGDCAGAFRDNTSSPNGGNNEQNNGSDCNGVGISNAVANINITNNNFSFLEEPIKVYESGSTPSCNNVAINNNSFTQYYRIMIETQCYTPGPVLMFIQYNATQTKWGGAGQSNIWSDAWSIANGCSNATNANCETHDDYNNLLETNSVIPGNTGNELWGSGVQGSSPTNYATQTTAIYNLFQGYWGNGIIWSPAGNFILSYNTFNLASGGGSDTNCLDHAGGYWNWNVQNGNVPTYTPTCIGNTFSSAITGTYPSAAPSLPASQSFSGTLAVPVTNTGTNRDINTTAWCTTDGSTPVAGGSAVTPGNTAQPYWTSATPGAAPTSNIAGTITVSSTTTVKCVGMWGAPNQPYSYPSGYSYVPSSVVSATYTSGGASPAATPTFSPAAGTYTGSQSVAISTTSSGANICWNTTGAPEPNGSGGCITGTLYTGAVAVASSETIYAVAGGAAYTESSIASAAYTINTQAATPTLSPSSESFSGSISVSISDTTPGATIYYTTNGTTPTTSSSVYSSAITVSSNTTIQAIAGGSGFTSSAVASGTYTLVAPTLSSVTITLVGGGTSVPLGGTGQACVNMAYTAPVENTTVCSGALDAYGNGAGTSWESLGTGIITSSTSGQLTGISVGSATIEATVGSFHPTLSVTVTPAVPSASTFSNMITSHSIIN